jgi:hypothetical protein
MQLFSSLIAGNPALSTAMINQSTGVITAGLSPAAKQIAGANLSGVNPQVYQAGQENKITQLPSGLIGTERETAVSMVNEFQKDLGLTQEGAAALVGNLMQEDKGFDPFKKNPKSGAYGIAQWLGTRKDQYFEFHEKYKDSNPQATELDVEKAFLKKELQQPEYAHVLQTLRAPGVSGAESAVVFRKEFEKPGEAEANDAARISNTNQLLGYVRKAGPRSPEDTQTGLRPVLENQATVDAAQLYRSNMNAQEFGQFLTKFNTGLAGIAASARKFADDLSKFSAETGTPMPGVPL